MILPLLLATMLHWSGTNPAMGDTGTYANPMPCPLATDSLIRNTILIPFKPCRWEWRHSAIPTGKALSFARYATFDTVCYVVVVISFSSPSMHAVYLDSTEFEPPPRGVPADSVLWVRKLTEGRQRATIGVAR